MRYSAVESLRMKGELLVYRVAIFDDDHRQCELLAELIARSPFGPLTEVSLFSELDDLATRIDKAGEPDICFMDIRAEGSSSDGSSAAGIQAVTRLFPASSRTQVIYVTGFPEYCVPVYETRHVYLLLKPVDPDQLQAALARAVANLRARERDFLALTVGSSVLRVPVSKISYVESMRRKAVVHTTEGDREVYAKLSDLAERLPSSFVRSHKSYLVNMDFIESIDRRAAQLCTGESVPVSRQKSAATCEAFRRYLMDEALVGQREGR